MNFFLEGGVTILLWLLLTISPFISFDPAAHLNVWGAIFALLIYQPHFLTTYFFNYSRGKNFILRHPVKLILFPVIYILILVFIGFDITERNQESYYMLQFIYLAVFIMGTWHFAMQAAAAVRKNDPLIDFRLLRVSLGIAGLVGIFKILNYHGGSISLLGLRTYPLLIPEFAIKTGEILAWLCHLLLIIFTLKSKISIKASIPWLAFIIWFSSDVFLKRYFYLVPVLHSLQYVPFYLERIKKIPNWGIISAILIGASILLVQVMPLSIDEYLESQSIAGFSIFFVSTLLFINLHHFVMETITWKTGQ